MFRSAALSLAFSLAICTTAQAQDRKIISEAPTADEYVDYLFKEEPKKPAFKTRGIIMPKAEAAATQAVVNTQNQATQQAPQQQSSKILAAPVKFAFNSHQVPAEFRDYLTNLATAMAAPEAQGKKVLITGHTDKLGDNAYNASLSVRRANAVKLFLINQGVSANSIVSRGMGETQLIAGQENNHALNRRVEFSIAD